MIKHDKYIETLCEQIQPRYDCLLKKVPLYSRKNRLVAEIDILAVKENVCDIYEVKCSFRITKAKKQLHRIKRSLMLLKMGVKNSFFFCGESGQLINI